MKIGERGQVTIPQEIREKFGLGPGTEVDFVAENGSLVVRKRAQKLAAEKWKGFCAPSFQKSGHATVDEFIEDIRGR